MTVKELKGILEHAPENLNVYVKGDRFVGDNEYNDVEDIICIHLRVDGDGKCMSIYDTKRYENRKDIDDNTRAIAIT